MKITPWNRFMRFLGLPCKITLEDKDIIFDGSIPLISVEEEGRIRDACQKALEERRFK